MKLAYRYKLRLQKVADEPLTDKYFSEDASERSLGIGQLFCGMEPSISALDREE